MTGPASPLASARQQFAITDFRYDQLADGLSGVRNPLRHIDTRVYRRFYAITNRCRVRPPVDHDREFRGNGRSCEEQAFCVQEVKVTRYDVKVTLCDKRSVLYWVCYDRNSPTCSASKPPASRTASAFLLRSPGFLRAFRYRWLR